MQLGLAALRGGVRAHERWLTRLVWPAALRALRGRRARVVAILGFEQTGKSFIARRAFGSVQSLRPQLRADSAPCAATARPLV